MLEAFVDSTEPRRVVGNGWQCPRRSSDLITHCERLEQDSGTMEGLPVTFTTSTVLFDVIKLRKRVDILPVRVRSTPALAFTMLALVALGGTTALITVFSGA